MRFSRIALLIVFATAVAPPVAAQPAAFTLRTQPSPFYYSALGSTHNAVEEAAAASVPLPLPKYGSWVRVTKWATLATAIGLGAAGALWHHDANQAFTQLDALCEADPDNCRERNPDGSYTDPVLEDIYQTVLRTDQRARTAFIGSQVSFGVSVLLFIVDFQRDDGPGNIPYDPEKEQSSLSLTATPAELAIRYYIN